MSRQFRSLVVKSAQIQHQIDSEHRRRAPDWMRLMRLKILRLRTKDRIRLLVATARRRSFGGSNGSSPLFCGPAPYRFTSLASLRH